MWCVYVVCICVYVVCICVYVVCICVYVVCMCICGVYMCICGVYMCKVCVNVYVLYKYVVFLVFGFWFVVCVVFSMSEFCFIFFLLLFLFPIKQKKIASHLLFLISPHFFFFLVPFLSIFPQWDCLRKSLLEWQVCLC